MNFGDAFKALKEGKKVRRPYMKHFNLQIAKVSDSHENVKFNETLIACSEDDNITRFTIPNEDIIAEDWEIVDEIPDVEVKTATVEYYICPSCKTKVTVYNYQLVRECGYCGKIVNLKRA